MHSLDNIEDNFTWTVWRRNVEEKFGISLNSDEFHNRVEVANIAYKSLAEEKNHRLSMFPSTNSYALKSGDVIIEAVNTLTDIEELQKELRTALKVELRVSRSRCHEAHEQFSGVSKGRT